MNNSFPPQGIRETRSSEIGSINNKARSIPKQIHLQGKYIRRFFPLKHICFSAYEPNRANCTYIWNSTLKMCANIYNNQDDCERFVPSVSIALPHLKMVHIHHMGIGSRPSVSAWSTQTSWVSFPQNHFSDLKWDTTYIILGFIWNCLLSYRNVHHSFSGCFFLTLRRYRIYYKN